MELARTNNELVDELVASGTLRSEAIISAFRVVDRVRFVPVDLRHEAYGDYPLPIGFGQTISQPTTVAFMLELLSPQMGQKVLEVGCGSGYVLALLSHIVGQSGVVVGVERVPELARLAQANLRDAVVQANITVITGDGSRGEAAQAPYNRILVSAAAHELPKMLLEQLTVGGRLVAPVGKYVQDVVLVERRDVGFVQNRYPGFQFVPLVTNGN